MGSESSPGVLFEAVLASASYLSKQDSLVVFLTRFAMESILRDSRFSCFLDEHSGLVDLHVVEEEISMEDDPLAAVRLKKESSVVVGLRLLKERNIDAFVSAGNTGAIVAAAALILPKMGLDRCCLLASLPTKKDPLAVLDVGGFLDPTPEILLQYARIGAFYQRALLGKETPNVGLMNIGVESKKGTGEVREAYRLLKQEEGGQFHFVGNIEGREAFEGGVDVLVTDGFTGNVLLKVSQGVSSFIFDYLKSEIKEILNDEVHQVIDDLHRHFRYDEHPGAFLCGVEGLVIKCHGAATVRSMIQSILGAKRLVQIDIINQIKRNFY